MAQQASLPPTRVMASTDVYPGSWPPPRAIPASISPANPIGEFLDGFYGISPPVTSYGEATGNIESPIALDASEASAIAAAPQNYAKDSSGQIRPGVSGVPTPLVHSVVEGTQAYTSPGVPGYQDTTPPFVGE